jgi:hypothetical protein
LQECDSPLRLTQIQVSRCGFEAPKGPCEFSPSQTIKIKDQGKKCA